TNGAESLPALEAEAEKPEQIKTPPAADKSEIAKARALVDAQVRPALGVVIRGLLVSFPGLPPHEILNSIARVAGKMMGESLMADMATHFRLRDDFKKAFADGVSQAPMKMPAPPGEVLKG